MGRSPCRAIWLAFVATLVVVRSGAASCITNVTVVDTVSGDAAPHRWVVIEGDRIVAVAGREAADDPRCDNAIDGTGKYLIPGLWDMHVHGTRREALYPVFLANGVTGVREMFGPPDAHAFRAALAASGLDVPRMVLASPVIDGVPVIWPGSISVSNAEEARRVAGEQKERGADFLKVYQTLSREAYFAVLGEANRLDIPVAGHVPSSISPWEAIAAGQKTIEHLVQVASACSSDETRLRERPVRSYVEALRMQVEASHSFDPAKCALLFEALRRNRVWVVPTFAAKRGDGWGDDPELARDPRLRYFDSAVRGFLAPAGEDPTADAWSDADRQVARELFAFEQKLVGEMFRAGVGILAGSDCLNPASFPGFGLHDELGSLVDAGLTPLAALRAATLDAASFLDRSDLYGTVAPGKMADLVLLDADPLQDIHNTRRIAAVVLGGKLFDRSTLDALLDGAERAASVQPDAASD